MTGFMSLPTELLAHIILYDTGVNHAWNVTCLCRRTYVIALPVLYQHPHVFGYRGAKRLFSVLRKQNLAACVISLHIRGSAQLHGRKIFTGSVSTWKQLELPALPSCWTLEVESHLTVSKNGARSGAIPLTIVAMWAYSCESLSCIRLPNLGRSMRAWKQPALVFPATVTQMEINLGSNRFVDCQFDPAFVSMLPAITRLVISCRCGDGFGVLANQVLEKFSSLEQDLIYLAIHEANIELRAFRSIQTTFPYLKYLHCGLPDTSDPTAFTFRNLHGLDIQIGGEYLDLNSTLTRFGDALNAGDLPALQKLTLHLEHDDIDTHRLVRLSNVEMACIHRMVQFSIMDDFKR